MAKVEEKKPLSLTAALGNRKKIGAPAMPAEEPKPVDPQAEENAKFVELEARVAALEAKLAGEEGEV